MPTNALLIFAKARAKSNRLPDGERVALERVRLEADRAGATLHSAGEGGLSPSLALGVYRRDGYRCKRCGGADDLSLHHKGGIFASTWLRAKGHANVPNNLVTLCNRCHDAIHQEARAAGVDSSQQREG